MNYVLEDMKAILDGDEEVLAHYGMPRRSGRYPWGSGEDGYQHNRDFLSRVEDLKKEGWTETPENIKNQFGLTTTQFRTEKALCASDRRALQVARAKSLQADGKGATEIGREMGIPESTVRSLLNPKSETNMNQAKNIAAHIKDQIDSKGMIDIGKGVERELGISKERLDQALYLLEREGYPIYKGGIPQATNPGQQTNQKVICPPGTEHKEIYNYDKIHALNEDNYVSRDNGNTFDRFVYPESMNSSRIKIRYADEKGPDGATGEQKDGIVEIRRGVKDLSLGDSHYSQIRVLVDGTHYVKGMAVYSDDLPDGVDMVFNTNKSQGTPMQKVLKEIKADPENPFGALVKANGQSYYDDPNGKYTDPITGKKQSLGLINRTRDEGDWDEWSNGLPSQFLSKQSLTMVKKQLGLAKADKLAEFDEICSNTNPTVKKHLLQKFADECDSAAVHLKAAALPGQKYHVIIPNNTLKDHEVYAPGYENGTQLALIRYPHGGTFEIPILTVNNKNALGKKMIGTQPIDAVCINKKNADRLSGADFDGDTVMCIPTNDRAGKVKIKNREPLKGLEGFDPKAEYGPDTYEGRTVRLLSKSGTQKQMGVISNLITDMTLDGGATDAELAAAVRHSMVIIDAHKHKLDYKKSEVDNNITALHQKYQGKKTGGASTIISRAKGEASVIKTQGTPKVNQKGKSWYDPSKPEGALIYKEADDAWYTYTKTNKRTGETTTVTDYKKQRTTKMAKVEDAYELVSEARNPKELAYADYANSMKALANRARKEMVYTGKIEYSASAKTTYQAEYDSLMSKLNTALLNTTRERAALRKTNAAVKAKIEADPTMDKKDIKKANQQAINKYRAEVGAVSRKDRNIKITDREWEAIQAGAITESKLRQILANTDIDAIRERSTPRSSTTLNTAQINRAKALSNSNYTLSEIAKKLGVSTSTVSSYLKGAS